MTVIKLNIYWGFLPYMEYDNEDFIQFQNLLYITMYSKNIMSTDMLVSP